MFPFDPYITLQQCLKYFSRNNNMILTLFQSGGVKDPMKTS